MTIQESFENYHNNHPDVYEWLIRNARALKNNGHAHYGIGALVEACRFHFDMRVDPDEEFKINNNYRSRYARTIMEREPDLAGFFALRTLQSE